MSTSQTDRFEKAYETHAHFLFRVALSHLGHPEDAMDAVQDVFFKLYISQKHFHDSEHERAWLLRTLINRCHDLARRQKIRAYIPLEEAAALGAQEEPCTYIFDDVKHLSTPLRKAVNLHYLEGFSVEETAAILNLSPSAVKMRLSRARDILKTALLKE